MCPRPKDFLLVIDHLFAPHNFRSIRGKKAVLEKGTTTTQKDNNNQKKPQQPIIAATDDIERRAKCLFKIKKHFASNEYS
tara:strand:- start:1172 stop:1411 length:240 start_codon:yes stop_codon:yes gene_type:complete